MLVERFWNADWGVRHRLARRGLLLRSLNPLLDFADVVEIVAEPRSILAAECLLEVDDILTNGIQNASIVLHPRAALLARSGTPEHPFEDDPRIDFHRQRRRLILPRDGVHVRAAVLSVAAADPAGEIFRRQLEGWKGRFLPDLVCDHLIDC